LAIAQRYFFNIPEPAASVIVGAGMVAGATSEIIFIPLPVQMRAAPTVTVSAGSFKFNLAGTATAVGTFAAGSTHTPNYISVPVTPPAPPARAPCFRRRRRRIYSGKRRFLTDDGGQRTDDGGQKLCPPNSDSRSLSSDIRHLTSGALMTTQLFIYNERLASRRAPARELV